MLGANEALERLREGNRRHVAGEPGERPPVDLVAGQEPFAVILGCSDSRVPPELVFDQGPGDLFVVRVAGHVITPSVVGSLAFAASQLGTRLAVVLGHSHCGAVAATLDHLRGGTPMSPDALRTIVDRIAPEVETLVERQHDPNTLLGDAVRANVHGSVRTLRDDPSLDDGMTIVGAEYRLETGVVEFLGEEG